MLLKSIQEIWQSAIFRKYFNVALIILEIFLCVTIIWKINYTEIDWNAYMQEVQGFWDGELNYTLIKGDTGPLVYPAGFLYVFSVIKWLTNDGIDIKMGSYENVNISYFLFINKL